MRATDSTPQPPARPALLERTAETDFAAELHHVRPALDAAFAAELPGARAAVLARLWRALLLEPLPLRPEHRGRIGGPDRRAHDIDAPPPGYAVTLDGRAFTHPATLLEALRLPGSAALLAEIEHSVVSLALSRAGARADGVDWVSSPSSAGESLAESERSVVDGHPYHPCCRSRPAFSVADQLAYAPEHGAEVGLELVPLRREQALVVGDWPAWLEPGGDGDGRLLPVHPWQARHVLPGLGFEVSGRRLPAAPLMSVRTLAPNGGGPHLKTSLSLRMTSAVRDISGGSVRNAPAVSALLEAVTAGLGGRLGITRNLAAAAALVDGEPSPDLAVIVRESPEAGLRAGERVVPLAVLAARPLKVEDPREWLAAFARLTWPPLLRLLDAGVALEAHGQNLLVVLDADDRPVRLVYRDLADIRVSPRRLARAGIAHPPVTGHVVSDEPEVLRRKLLASLLGSSFGGLVSGFASAASGRPDRAEEARLWTAVAEEARRASELLRDPGDRRALLSDPLPLKALTLMRLERGPGAAAGDLWTSAANPLAAAGGYS